MPFYGQHIVPAAKNVKQFESLLESNYEVAVFLDTHIGQLRMLHDLARQGKKKCFCTPI